MNLPNLLNSKRWPFADIIREFQRLNVGLLSELISIAHATLYDTSVDRDNLRFKRAKVLAKALQCHPAALVFPGWTPPADAGDINSATELT